MVNECLHATGNNRKMIVTNTFQKKPLKLEYDLLILYVPCPGEERSRCCWLSSSQEMRQALSDFLSWCAVKSD